ncbi:hypothetical protein CHISP_2060 [Chitinispirillum alkaliphilum]|nr:hypothetical protein CHISP_2060 [Chitinispirillum alkaliphilum]
MSLRGMTRFEQIIICCVLIISGAFLVWMNKSDVVPSGVLTYDEADYAYAVNQGFVANYLDIPNVSFIQFVSMGVNKGMDRSKWSSLSEEIRSSGDINFYRHFHAPLYYYYLIIVNYIANGNEHLLRYSTSLFTLITAIILIMVIWFLMKPISNPSILLLPFVGLLTSPAFVKTNVFITPHGMYAAISLLTLMMIAMLIKTKDRIYFTSSCICLGISLLTFEYTPFLFAVFIIALYMNRNAFVNEWGRKQFISYTFRGVLIIGLVVLILWPAGIIKLSLLKNYMFFTYFAIFRGGEYGSISLFQVWVNRISESPIEYLFFLISIIYIARNYKSFKWLQPFLLYALLVFSVTLRNRSHMPQYVSSMIPSLYVIFGVALAHFLSTRPDKKWKKSFASLVVIVFSISVYSSIENITETIDDLKCELIQCIDGIRRAEASLGCYTFTPREFMPTLNYYLYRQNLIPYCSNRDPVETLVENIEERYDESVITVIIHPFDYGSKLKSELVEKLNLLNTKKIYVSETLDSLEVYYVKPISM